MPVDEVFEAFRRRQRHPWPVEEEHVEHDRDAKEKGDEEEPQLEHHGSQNPGTVKLLKGEILISLGTDARLQPLDVLIRQSRLFRLATNVYANSIEGFLEDLDKLFLQTNDWRNEDDHHEEVTADAKTSKHCETLNRNNVADKIGEEGE